MADALGVALGSPEVKGLDLEWKIQRAGDSDDSPWEAKQIVGGTMASDDETGVVTLIPTVTGIVDEVDDVILPAAYGRTLTERIPKGVWSHDWGTWVARTDQVGELLPGDDQLPSTWKGKQWPRQAGACLVRATFNLGTQAGLEAYRNVKFFDAGPLGQQVEYSIGYQVPAGEALRNSQGWRLIKMLKWFEWCPVLFGAMPLAGTLASDERKTAEGGAVIESKVVRERIAVTPPAPAAEHVEADLITQRLEVAGKGWTPTPAELAAAHRRDQETKLAGREVTPSDVRNTDKLKRYWAHGAGAAKIRWGVPNDFYRCLEHVGKFMPPGEAKGYCALRHHEATGAWPGHAATEQVGHKAVPEDAVETKEWSDAARAAALEARRNHMHALHTDDAGRHALQEAYIGHRQAFHESPESDISAASTHNGKAEDVLDQLYDHADKHGYEVPWSQMESEALRRSGHGERVGLPHLEEIDGKETKAMTMTDETPAATTTDVVDDDPEGAFETPFDADDDYPADGTGIAEGTDPADELEGKSLDEAEFKAAGGKMACGKSRAACPHTMGDDSYPIHNADEVSAAVNSYPRGAGKGKTKGDIRKHIMAGAKRVGAAKKVPNTWPEKREGKGVEDAIAEALESKDYPYLPGSVEERQDALRDALRELLLPEPDAEGRVRAYVSLDGTFADRVVATLNDWSSPSENTDEQTFVIPYTTDEDGNVSFSDPQPVEKVVSLQPADAGGAGGTDPNAQAVGERPAGTMGGAAPAQAVGKKVVGLAEILGKVLGGEDVDGKSIDLTSPTHVRRLRGAQDALAGALAGLGLNLGDAAEAPAAAEEAKSLEGDAPAGPVDAPQDILDILDQLPVPATT